MMKLIKFVGAASLIAILSACGGGGSSAKTVVDGNPNAPTEPEPETPAGPPKVTPTPDVSDGTPAGSLTRTAATSNCQLTQSTGGFPDRQLSIAAARFVQVVEQDMTEAASQLAAEKAVLVRVDVVSPQDVALPAKATLQIGSDTGNCANYDLVATNQTAPTERDATVLSKSYVARIPAAVVSAGWADYQVVIDPLRQSTTAAANRLYVTGPLRVRPAVTDTYVYVPISFEGQVGQFATVSKLEELIKRVFPQSSMTFTTDPVRTLAALDKDKALRVENGVYVFDFKTMSKALSEVDFECFERQGSIPQFRVATKCLAAFPSNIRFVSGSSKVLGIATSVSMLSESFVATDNNTITSPYNGFWLNRGADTFIHEMGHVQSLGHANCGDVDQVDSDLYDDGSLGPIGVGYDSGRDFYFQALRGNFFDMMSYCGNGWMSDKGYRKVISFKSGDNDDPTIMARSTNDAGGSSPRMVYLAKDKSQWKVFSSPAPHELAVLSPAQMTALLPAALSGLKVSVYRTDAGPMLDGPYYLSNTPDVLSKLTLLGVVDSALQQLNSVVPEPR